MTSLAFKEHKEHLKRLGIPRIDPNKQSVEKTGTKEYVHVNPITAKLGPDLDFFQGMETLHDVFKRGMRLSNNGSCYGWRPEPKAPYRWVTYDHIYKRAGNFGSGLIADGVEPGQQTMIGLYSQNRIGWSITEQACNRYSFVLIPLYDTLGPDACKFIVNQADIGTVVCDTESRAKLLLEKADQMPVLKRIVMMSAITDELRKRTEQLDIKLLQYREVEENGLNNKQPDMLPKKSDLCTVCYTSGTTGNPKGAMLTHGNVISNLSAFMALIHDKAPISDETHFSYLPLAHIYERFAQALILAHGGRIGYSQGDIKLLTDDIQALKPTIMPVVPRVMNRIYDKFLQGVKDKGKLKYTVFNLARKKKLAQLMKGNTRTDTKWDKVFKPLRDIMGGNIRFMTTGSAPTTEETKNFFRCVLGVTLLEGYGQTETTAIVTCGVPADMSPGHVGAVLPNTEIKLVDVPDMNYYAKNGEGEICSRGSNIFIGYLKDEEKTRETFDEDGWMHSGDIGKWLPNGTLKIIDRKKHIFKLQQGEYVAPEKIETYYQRSEYVGQVYVHGDSLQSYCVAIIVPDEEVLLKVGKSKGFGNSFEQLCKRKEVNKMILDDCVRIGKQAGLNSFEQAKKVFLCAELFSLENGLLTPTMKSKRPALKNYFKSQIDAMYGQ
ncbi:long-chain-fatty-acid--CoA ligase 6-like [Lytechinus pictus]|uniref:long-chain-fatty-acid--CoA ligase 6-like n=1 Tax=Lytechinus pictus TaxID=7653 RepID=UPI0030B9BCDF